MTTKVEFVLQLLFTLYGMREIIIFSRECEIVHMVIVDLNNFVYAGSRYYK